MAAKSSSETERREFLKLAGAATAASLTTFASAEAGQQALAQYKRARHSWAAMAGRAKHVYRDDITYGHTPLLRGHWTDRLPAIDSDLAAMNQKLATPSAANTNTEASSSAIQAAMGTPSRPPDTCRHRSPESFRPGQPLNLAIEIRPAAINSAPVIARLFYRHVNQPSAGSPSKCRTRTPDISPSFPPTTPGLSTRLSITSNSRAGARPHGCTRLSMQHFPISLTTQSPGGARRLGAAACSITAIQQILRDK